VSNTRENVRLVGILLFVAGQIWLLLSLLNILSLTAPSPGRAVCVSYFVTAARGPELTDRRASKAFPSVNFVSNKRQKKLNEWISYWASLVAQKTAYHRSP